MEIEVVLAENTAHVKLRGRLDARGADQIETKFTASVVPAHRNTAVDLSDVDFIASMGLRMFIGVAKALKRNGAKFVLFAPQPQVNEVFISASLADIIPVVADEAEALRSIAA
jgi:anti-anti-sigma factor